MWRKNFPLLIALCGVLFAVFVVNKARTPPPSLPPMVEPSLKPYFKGVAASGIIEAVRENVIVDAPANGLVDAVYVDVWSHVKKGDPLFKMESEELEADLMVAKAKEEVAAAQLAKLQGQLERLLAIKDPRAISLDDIRNRENDVRIANATLDQALAESSRIVKLLGRLTVRSPIDGLVIQKNIKPGEYISVSTEDPMIVGDISSLQIRADIDEQNASQVVAHAPAIAYPKNHPDKPIPLRFVQIEPFVIPKKSLTGLNNERVDTRVLQVIYTFDPPKDIPLYIGQQVDVFIDVPDRVDSTKAMRAQVDG